jgi:hypothetical protein
MDSVPSRTKALREMEGDSLPTCQKLPTWFGLPLCIALIGFGATFGSTITSFSYPTPLGGFIGMGLVLAAFTWRYFTVK